MLSIPTFHSDRVALLIDADNAQLNQLEKILRISRCYGNLKLCRAYGDWKKPPLSTSYSKVQGLNIKTIQVDRLAKDTSDKQLLIEAVEILVTNSADVFIIVSGDGDFKQLCDEIKQKGRKVVGIGNKGQSSTRLKTSCDAFHYIENLEKDLISLEQKQEQILVFHALDSMPRDKEGWVNLALLGAKLRELDSGFEARLGNKKLSKWLFNLNHHLEVNGQMVRYVILPQ